MATYIFRGKSYATSSNDVVIDVTFNGQTVYNDTVVSTTTSTTERSDELVDLFTFTLDDSIAGGSYPLTVTPIGTNGKVWFGEILRDSEEAVLDADGNPTTDANGNVVTTPLQKFVATIIDTTDGKDNVLIDGSATDARIVTAETSGSWQYQIPVGSTLTCDILMDAWEPL